MMSTIISTSRTNNINYLFVNAQQGGCTPCASGTTFLSATCPDELSKLDNKVNGLFDTDQECVTLQLSNYQNGCCTGPPFDSCSYCKDPTATPNLDLTVPTGQFADPYTCYDYSYQNEAYIGMFKNEGDCDDTFLRRAGHYCGCGETQQQECYLCPDGNPPSKPQRTDEWITGTNCRGIEYLFSLFNTKECIDFPFMSGGDLSIYCGCGGLNQTQIDEQQELFTCSLCENGGSVTNPNTQYDSLPSGSDGSTSSKTCKQAEDFAATIIKTPSGCRNTQYFGKAREVCTCSDVSSSSSSRSSRVIVSSPFSSPSKLSLSFSLLAIATTMAMAILLPPV